METLDLRLRPGPGRAVEGLRRRRRAVQRTDRGARHPGLQPLRTPPGAVLRQGHGRLRPERQDRRPVQADPPGRLLRQAPAGAGTHDHADSQRADGSAGAEGGWRGRQMPPPVHGKPRHPHAGRRDRHLGYARRAAAQPGDAHRIPGPGARVVSGMAAIAWQQGGLAAAFALAAARQRPLFLYWGAVWCPPCNRVKSDIFARDEFVERSASVVCCQLDGDSAGAQALAAQYGLRSYPTLVLYAPYGSEITRLPCELDGELFTAAFDAALAVHEAGSSASIALAAALSGERKLSAGEWSLLSHYSWDTDEGRLLGTRALAPTLLALVRACDDADAGARLQLHAQLATAGKDVDAAANAALLLKVFADARLARANMDILGNSGVALIKFATRREELVAALGATAAQWADDFWLSAPDRLTAVRLQMRLGSLLAPTQGMQEQVRLRVEAALAESTDRYERHTLVNTAVSALNDAGLPAQAEQVLLAELPRSHSPYYFMLSLASSAKRRGDMAGMLDWYHQAWQAAVGPATRLQWGVTYLLSLLELAPQDSARIAQAEQDLRADIAAAGADAHHQRNQSQLQKLRGQV